MADADFYTHKPQTLGAQVPPNTSKFYTHFLYKVVIVSVFLLVLPIFPSQAPEFINQKLNTRSWELLQLLFVGLAVSYGLFSRRSQENDKEIGGTKSDSAQSYVAKLLQVSSVFDDESESPSGDEDNTKVQTWNSQYYRGEPVLVVAQENSVFDEHSVSNTQTGENPLRLPVRSLKSRNLDSSSNESVDEPLRKANSLSRSKSRSSSRRFSGISMNAMNEEITGVSPEVYEEKEEEAVLRSPIPWRSRSGRMEINEDLDSPPTFSLPPSTEDFDPNSLKSRSFRSQSSRSNIISPFPASEMQAKDGEDLVRRKNVTSRRYSLPPSPPPPPPPPASVPYRSPLMQSIFSPVDENGFSEKELKRSVRSVPEELPRDDTWEFPNRGDAGEEWKLVRNKSTNSVGGRSVRTNKGRGMLEDFANKKFDDFIEINNAKACETVPSFTPKVEVKELADHVLVEDDEDSDNEDMDREGDDKFEELPRKEDVSANDANDVGPDVDKKADEFIAKFREQIRLQRIASIRRSTGQIHKNSVT